MNKYRIRSCALNQTALDWNGNLQRVHHALIDAEREQVDLLCFPELVLSGYGCEDAFYHPATADTALEILFELASATLNTQVLAFVGLPLRYDHRLYNAVAILQSGEVRGFVLKRNLANDGVYYEPRWFTPWSAGRNFLVTCGSNDVLAGDLVVRYGDALIGLEICEDAWSQTRRAHDLAACGANLIVNPSASHFALKKYQQRLALAAEGARLVGGLYAYCNLLGNDSGRLIFDGDTFFAASTLRRDHATDGKIPDEISIARTERFSFFDSSMATIEFGFQPRKFQSIGAYECLTLTPRRKPAHPEDVSHHALPASVQAPILWTPLKLVSKTLSDDASSFEEIFACVTLGLFDYLRKSHSQGFVVSLSGGVDSAIVAYLAAHALRQSFRALGNEQWNAKCQLGGFPVYDELQLLERGLTCVYQASAHSSTSTEDAAESVARSLGAAFLRLNIEPIVQQYLSEVTSQSPLAGLPPELNWTEHDISLQNIQARVRGPSVWLVANLRGALLLATSNRSEAAVGYTTMDGDTCGGLSPIAGLDKPFLRRFLRWLVESGPTDVGPFAGAERVMALEPTAELRPAEFAQTDEKDLMPYEILDAIERSFLLERKGPSAILEVLKTQFNSEPSTILERYLVRFFTLWSRNQWKRERYAPSFHLDESSLDPKAWCRFPILSGGFQRELADIHSRKRSQ